VEQLESLIEQLKSADWKGRDAVREQILAAAKGSPDQAKDFLENARKNLSLELKWEIDDVLEALEPEPEPEPEAAEEEAAPEEPVDPNAPLSASDLKEVYNDPRGLILYTDRRTGTRWFATQVNPYTRQPETFELQAAEVDQLKQQLAGSPYWVLGAGAV